LKVFVYGTLKPGESNYRYCADAIAQLEAYTWGRLFHLPLGYPAMTSGTSKVRGFLLTFKDETILESLDALEDYQPQRSPQDNEYQRQKISIYSLAGKPLGKAWSYLMTDDKVKQLNGIFLPSGCWAGNKNNVWSG
jgi:gamma-glutamylcyclotransferase (GGCT)/AIG2-like uncharacterized protein YtfP